MSPVCSEELSNDTCDVELTKIQLVGGLVHSPKSLSAKDISYIYATRGLKQFRFQLRKTKEMHYKDKPYAIIYEGPGSSFIWSPYETIYS